MFFLVFLSVCMDSCVFPCVSLVFVCTLVFVLVFRSICMDSCVFPCIS